MEIVEGKLVEYDDGVKKGRAIIRGIATTSMPIIGKGIIVELIDKYDSYQYSHIVFFESQLKEVYDEQEIQGQVFLQDGVHKILVGDLKSAKFYELLSDYLTFYSLEGLRGKEVSFKGIFDKDKFIFREHKVIENEKKETYKKYSVDLKPNHSFEEIVNFLKEKKVFGNFNYKLKTPITTFLPENIIKELEVIAEVKEIFPFTEFQDEM